MKKAAIFLLVCTMVGLAGCGSEPSPQPHELQTPQYAVSQIPPDIDLSSITEEEIHHAGGIKVIDDVPNIPLDSTSPDELWLEDNTVTYNAFTLPEKAAFSDDSGSIGILSIPDIQLTVKVYEAADEMEAMELGAAHFKSTSAWDGNVGISAHNVNFNGTDGYFKDLHKLKVGAVLTYETALGIRIYTVTKVKTIPDNDWSYLSRSTENRVTLITCISGKPDKRLMVQAIEKR